jgi:short-subunit dehydrogenase
LEGKGVVVTGANSGIGEAIAPYQYSTHFSKDAATPPRRDVAPS